MTIDWSLAGDVSAILLLFMLADLGLRKWLKIKESEEVKKAKELLEKNGFTSHIYIPSIGVNNKELAEAMARVSSDGYVLLDKEGKLVGKVLPNLRKEKHTSLRLVVDNT